MLKKIFLISFFSVLILTGCSANSWRKSFSQHSQVISISDSILNNIINNYNNIVIYNISSDWSDNYTVLASQKDSWFTIKYVLKKDALSANESPYTYSINPLKKFTADSVWNVFVQNQFWEIQSESPGSCDHNKKETGCVVDDGSWSSLTMISDKKTVTKRYYEPAFFETSCCPGDKNRQVFLKCLMAMKLIQ